MIINVVIPTFVGILAIKKSFVLDLSIHFLYMEGNIGTSVSPSMFHFIFHSLSFPFMYGRPSVALFN